MFDQISYRLYLLSMGYMDHRQLFSEPGFVVKSYYELPFSGCLAAEEVNEKVLSTAGGLLVFWPAEVYSKVAEDRELRFNINLGRPVKSHMFPWDVSGFQMFFYPTRVDWLASKKSWDVDVPWYMIVQ